MRVERITLSEWKSALPSDGFEVFHLPAALRVVERHADAEMKLFGGFKGQQPIALLPVFVNRKSLGTTVTSPPPGMGIPRLGPILMPTSPKRRKQEKVNNEFTETVLERIDADLDSGLNEQLTVAGIGSLLAKTVVDRLALESRLTRFQMVANAAYGDPRPYAWDDLHVELDFTHVLNLEDQSAEELHKSFSDRFRRRIREADASDVRVEREKLAGAREVFRTTETRCARTDESFPLSWSYVRDLFETLADEDRARAYVARDSSGEYHSGLTVLYSNDRAYCWQGDTAVGPDATAADALVHWRAVEDALDAPPDESVARYDLLDAAADRPCLYETELDAELESYYVVSSSGSGLDVAGRASE